MQNDIQKQLKDQVDALEKALLAVTSVSDIQMENVNSGAPVINPDHTAYLLEYLMEPVMTQVESLRVLIHGLQNKAIASAKNSDARSHLKAAK